MLSLPLHHPFQKLSNADRNPECGGVPTAQDRILASRLGVAAIEALKDGQRNIMVGVKNDQIVYVPFNKAIRIAKPIDRELINVLNVLSI